MAPQISATSPGDNSPYIGSAKTESAALLATGSFVFSEEGKCLYALEVAAERVKVPARENIARFQAFIQPSRLTPKSRLSTDIAKYG
jgi:hypothetical protein